MEDTFEQTVKTEMNILSEKFQVEQFLIRSKSQQAVEILTDKDRAGFCFCLSGESKLTPDKNSGETVQIRNGMCGIYSEPKGMINTAEYNSEKPFSMLSITIPHETMGELFPEQQATSSLLRRLGAGKTVPPSLFRFFPARPGIRTIISQILSPPVEKTLYPLYLEGKMLELTALMIQSMENEKKSYGKTPVLTSADRAKLLHACEILNENIENPPSLMAVARECGISTDRLSKGFRMLTGQTVCQYIRDCRMEKARKLLRSGEYNVTEACLEVGYSNLSHFARIYKNYFGYNPKQEQIHFYSVQ